MNAQEIVMLLSRRGETLASAESLTAGLFSAEICNVSGASQCFLGGLCAYQDHIKANMLSVFPETLEKYSAVSASCARQMAKGAREKFGSDYALSTTGYAGPAGEDVGLVFIGLSTKDGEKAFRLRLSGSRQGIRKMTVQIALHILQKEIIKNG